MLVNLLDNALKYTGDDKRVEVALPRAGRGRYSYEVSDNGIGHRFG